MNRDPKLIFVGMASASGEMKDQTEQGWRLFDQPIAGYTFIKRKVKCFSTSKGRNIITHMARQTAASKLLMVDSDMCFGVAQIERILSHNEMLVGGMYPKKTFSLTPQWVCNFTGKTGANGLAEVLDVGAGFLSIDMQVFDRIIEYDQRHIPQDPNDLWDILAPAFLAEDVGIKGEKIYQLWAERIAESNWNGNGVWPRLLTEDFYFCWAARQLGFTVWVDTVCQIGHIGEIDYLQLTAAIQQLQEGGHAPATAPQLPV